MLDSTRNNYELAAARSLGDLLNPNEVALFDVGVKAISFEQRFYQFKKKKLEEVDPNLISQKWTDATIESVLATNEKLGQSERMDKWLVSSKRKRMIGTSFITSILSDFIQQAYKGSLKWVAQPNACKICRPHHNKRNWKKEFPDGPPAHVGCNCTLVP